jgi:hypothetical protein
MGYQEPLGKSTDVQGVGKDANAGSAGIARERSTRPRSARWNAAGLAPTPGVPSHFLRARVRAAFLAARDLAALDRLRAAERVCFDNAFLDPAARPSLFNAPMVARERFREVDFRPPFCARFVSRVALRRASSETVPFFGGGNLTPARRALDNPIAMACRADRAPCLPCRTCSISSRTNSPACVEVLCLLAPPHEHVQEYLLLA